MKKHISYSEVRIWNECAYKHKLKYLDKINEFNGNEFTLFGTALHDVCEKMLISGSSEGSKYFTHRFLSAIEEFKLGGGSLDPQLLSEMNDQGVGLSPKILPGVEKYFGGYEVFSTEEKLYEEIEGVDNQFKGYIDAVLKKGDTYHIIDWKTCSWGWNARKKADKVLNYQLTLYKHFFAKKHKIDPKNIETYFALLKRTAKKDQVEIFRVTSGPKKIKNCLNLLQKALYNIKNKNYVKNRLSCERCEFYRTRHCV